MPSLGIAPGPEGCSSYPMKPPQDRHRHRVSFSGGCELSSSGDWDSSNQAFAMSRGSSRHTVPNTWAQSPVYWHALVPFTFRYPGKPSDPQTSLRVRPDCVGDITTRLVAHCERSFLPCVVGFPGNPLIGMVPLEARKISTDPIDPCRSWLKARELSLRTSWGAPWASIARASTSWASRLFSS